MTKIEQLGTGAVYCQILDACFQGEVSLQKVNWRARLEWEFVNNFKILQQAFDKFGINKFIEVYPKIIGMISRLKNLLRQNIKTILNLLNG